MWRSLFLSSTSLALALPLALGGAAGCSDDSCGPMGAPAAGLKASSVDVTLTFGSMTSRAGSDCPDPSTPDVISVAIDGMQTDGTGFIAICIPRPDQLMQPGRTLGLTTSMSDIRLIDLSGNDGTCSYELDKTRPPTGSGTGVGVCSNGTDKAGFAIDLDGAISLRRTCGSTIDTVGVKLIGKVAVAAE